MQKNYEKLMDLLKELFQLDQADLDFGIYRIMNAKRDEIVKFLEEDLLPQVQEILKFTVNQKGQSELEEAINNAKSLGVNPDTIPKVKELKEKYGEGQDLSAIENEVYSHLYNFFRRYYKDGDFISQRRYKKDVYAIPYEGEEVKLYWANHDQYYIKTSENFKDYSWKTPSGKVVHFKLVEASTEQDNKKAVNGKERRFILSDEEPLKEENGELFIRFEYRPDTSNRKQDQLNQIAAQAVLSSTAYISWISDLKTPAPTEKNKDRTLLEKHLITYTAKNTFDYFIHKDLGGFLKRELDFYIKNEIVHLDDIEDESATKVEQYMTKVKGVRKIAIKIITFLEQLESFQKKLWLKKKFVVETNYCVTLDKVPKELYSDIAQNEVQINAWVDSCKIDKIEGDLLKSKFSIPLTTDFLNENTSLMIDTKFYNSEFKEKLLASFQNLDELCDGVLINSENFQALNLWDNPSFSR